MKVDLTGRNGQDIGPMLRNLWTYGETLELGPPGSYFSSPQVFPSLRPWGESRCAIEGMGVQGVEISPLPGIQWQAEQPMWLFTGGRSRVTNLLFSDPNTSHQRTFLQFGNGSTILSNCYVEALDLRQYRRGLVCNKVDGMYVRRVEALGSTPGADVQAHSFFNCNGVVGEYNWTEGGGRHVLWQATEHVAGLNEGFNWTGDGCAEVDVGIELRGGNNLLLGDDAASIDCRVGGVGIKLVGTPEHPLVRVTVKGWLGGNGTKAMLVGPGVSDIVFDNAYVVSNKRFGREDGIVLVGDADHEPWIGLQGGVWRISTRAAQFRGLGRAIVEHQWKHKGAGAGVMPVQVDSNSGFDDCLENVVQAFDVSAVPRVA
jgi:hypothetical protein